MRCAVLVVGAMLRLSAALGAGSEGVPVPSVELPPGLARVLADYESAWRAHDAAALANLFSEDGLVLSNGTPPVRGRAAIRRAYAGAGGPLVLRAFAYAAEGSTGYIVGGFSRQPGEPDVGKFTLTLRKEGGRWMIASDMDNSNRSAWNPEALLKRVDHLVYAAPDLEEAIADLEKRLGVRATPGGRHPGRGTRNALIALSHSSYLEILAPDPDQPRRPGDSLWFGLDALKTPRLAAWAARGTDLERLAAEAERRGTRLGKVMSGSRSRPDGVLLSWTLTDPTVLVGGGIVPFFIDWGDSPHPAGTAAPGATLIRLRAEHPDPKSVQDVLDRLGVELRVERGPAPALIATIRTARGDVELR